MDAGQKNKSGGDRDKSIESLLAFHIAAANLQQ